MPWKPKFEGEYPTLGWYALEWITEYLAQPDLGEYQPLSLTPEQAQFVLRYYRLDPETGRRVYRRGVWSRPKGHGKSPLMGAFAALEGLADVVPAGWDADGRPVGRPWSSVRTPLVQLAAVNEKQTANAYVPMVEMLRLGPVIDEYPGVEPMDTYVSLPRGRIDFITAGSARGHEGGKPCFVALDQTEGWVPSNGGVSLAATLRRNAGKIGGSSIETPNAFLPGEDSVAQRSAEYFDSIKEGRAMETGLLYDHREAPATTDMSDRESLLDGLRYVYGDSAKDAGGWVDLERLVGEIWDPATDPQDARRFYLNQVTHASDSWLSRPELMAVVDVEKTVRPDEPIVVGFDGSRGRARGVADATALIGCRVSDGHLFVLDVWEQPRNVATWSVPVAEVSNRVREVFDEYTVVGFYADPNGWTSQVSEWESKYAKHLKVKARRDAPMSYWPKGKDSSVPRLVEELHDAVVNEDCSLDGSSVLVRHMLNARRRKARSGYLLYKAYPDSPDKVDAAYAAVMAWKARLDAVSAGAGSRRRRMMAEQKGVAIR